MTILDPCMSLERIRKILGALGVVDMRQILLKGHQLKLNLSSIRNHKIFGTPKINQIE